MSKTYAIDFVRPMFAQCNTKIMDIKLMRGMFIDPRDGCANLGLTEAKNIVETIHNTGRVTVFVTALQFAAFRFNEPSVGDSPEGWMLVGTKVVERNPNTIIDLSKGETA